MMKISISEIAQQAQAILAKTKYAIDKSIISHYFKTYITGLDYKAQIQARLTIIDSYYSTNMSKRYFGIEDLSQKLLEMAASSELQVSSSIEQMNKLDEKLKERFINYAKNPDNEVELTESLFNLKYGMNKSGSSGKAISLISKYAYFLTNYRFPIYDNLVKNVYGLIVKHIGLKEKLPKDDFKEYVVSINKLKQETGIKEYDTLDNFLWLTGKVRKGNFSLILSRETLSALIKRANIPKMKSNKFDKELSEKIFDCQFDDIFSKEQKNFIEFVKKLK